LQFYFIPYKEISSFVFEPFRAMINEIKQASCFQPLINFKILSRQVGDHYNFDLSRCYVVQCGRHVEHGGVTVLPTYQSTWCLTPEDHSFIDQLRNN
jgi:predicted peptidase